MGLGTRQGGLGVTRYLVAAGAEVTVTDLRSEEKLESSLRQLDSLPVRYRLGEHRAEDFVAADVVVRNPGVPEGSPWLKLARENGATVEMEMSLFFRACPAPIIGITGTKGKTTTSTLCASIMSRCRRDTVLAGNMGRSALESLDGIDADTPVIIELSSWQLEGLGEHGLSPHIAVFTNFSPDHLNRYESMASYLDAKLHIARYQGPEDWFVVNADDETVWARRNAGAGIAVPFSTTDHGHDGAYLDDDRLIWRSNGQETSICDVADLGLQGRHNVMNALAASAAALLAGASLDHVREGLASTLSVIDRQEIVAEVDGVVFVNDTTATTPAAVVAALDRFGDRPIVLIAGGSEKGVALDDLAGRLATSVSCVVLLDGAATSSLKSTLQAAGAQCVLGPHGSMEVAVRDASRVATPGSVVLLSPGCASFGMFDDEFQRGSAFREAVTRLRSMSQQEVTR